MTIGQKPLKDHLEAIGHRDAFRFLLSQVSEGRDLDERFIKDLHSLVLADKLEDRGVYRRIPVFITGAAHTPPQPYLVAPQMEAWVRELKATRLHPLVAAAESHIRFEAIHPFIDGNGRTGRLLVNFILMRSGYLPISVKYENRVAYYEAFTAYHRDGELEPMVKIVLEAERDRLAEWLRIVGESDGLGTHGVSPRSFSFPIAPAMKYRERSKLVGRGLRPRRNRHQTQITLNCDCGSPGVRSLPNCALSQYFIAGAILRNTFLSAHQEPPRKRFGEGLT